MKVILDTSTLLALEEVSPFIGHFNDNESYSKMINLEPVENAIEAFILYDSIFIDGSSFELNRSDNRIILSDIECFSEYIQLTQEEENLILEKISNKLLKNISDSKSELSKIIHKNDEKANISYITSATVFRSSHLSLFHKYFSAKNIINTIDSSDLYRKEFLYLDRHENFFYHLVRYFYYLELQQRTSSGLVLHPNRNDLAQIFSNNKTIYTNKIINRFEPIRRKLYDKETDFLGISDNSLLMPMVAFYVFHRCKSPKDLFKIISDIKYSKEAEFFREGLNDLTNAVKNKNYEIIDEVLSSLDNATMEWNKSLKYDPARQFKTISLSVPVIGGLSTDIDIPYSFGRSISTNLLTFIHKMLTNR